MTNREKYKEEILDIVFNDDTVAISIKTEKPVPCHAIDCEDCLLAGSDYYCEGLKEWGAKENDL